MFSLLCIIKALVDAKDKYEWTPLHIAVFRMNFDLVKYLIEVGYAGATAVSSVGSVAELE
jgi:ankyrin repeat protein